MALKITKVMYQRVSNLGNYEAERVEAEAEVGAKEDPDKVLAELKTWVNTQLGIEPELTAKDAQKLRKQLERFDRVKYAVTNK